MKYWVEYDNIVLGPFLTLNDAGKHLNAQIKKRTEAYRNPKKEGRGTSTYNEAPALQKTKERRGKISRSAK